MTETMIDLPGVIAKSDDTDFLRELTRRTPMAASTEMFHRQSDDLGRCLEIAELRRFCVMTAG